MSNNVLPLRHDKELLTKAVLCYRLIWTVECKFDKKIRISTELHGGRWQAENICEFLNKKDTLQLGSIA